MESNHETCLLKEANIRSFLAERGIYPNFIKCDRLDFEGYSIVPDQLDFLRSALLAFDMFDCSKLSINIKLKYEIRIRPTTDEDRPSRNRIKTTIVSNGLMVLFIWEDINHEDVENIIFDWLAYRNVRQLIPSLEEHNPTS